MSKYTELLKRGPHEDCGCIEEEWIVDFVHLLLHEEEDGSVHVFFDAGDEWEHETLVEDCDLDTARELAFQWVFNLPDEPAPFKPLR
jgi:hypothetical protein